LQGRIDFETRIRRRDHILDAHFLLRCDLDSRD